MHDPDCVRFLQWALPRLRMRWAGFRRVRRQVCKRIARRLGELGLADTAAYETFLEAHPEEWARLDALCRITISRFFRDRRVFEFLGDEVLPDLARRAEERGDGEVRCWSAGCASGEEPYTVAMIWHFSARENHPGRRLRVIATDADERLLERARRGTWTEGSLRNVPPPWREQAFERRGDLSIKAFLKDPVEFRLADIRRRLPDGPFDLVLCRNLVLTYFEESLQRQILRRIAERLLPGGALVIGIHEALPAGEPGFSLWVPGPGVYRRNRSGP
jgi:chemotaxis protein methyltransferase CheR